MSRLSEKFKSSIPDLKQGLAKQSIHIMSILHKIDATTIESTTIFQIIERNAVTKLPSEVSCTSTQKVWRVGDYVTNGTKMKGRITGFEFFINEDNSTINCYITHTWSGVGMAIQDLQELILLPVQFQIGDRCAIKFGSIKIPKAEVKAVHFFEGKAKYDLEITISDDGNVKTRIYNVDSLICENV